MGRGNPLRTLAMGAGTMKHGGGGGAMTMGTTRGGGGGNKGVRAQHGDRGTTGGPHTGICGQQYDDILPKASWVRGPAAMVSTKKPRPQTRSLFDMFLLLIYRI